MRAHVFSRLVLVLLIANGIINFGEGMCINSRTLFQNLLMSCIMTVYTAAFVQSPKTVIAISDTDAEFRCQYPTADTDCARIPPSIMKGGRN